MPALLTKIPNLAKFAVSRIHQPFDLLPFAEMGANSKRFCAGLLQLTSNRFAILEFAARHDYSGALLRERPGYCESETAAAARNNRNFSGKVEIIFHLYNVTFGIQASAMP